MKARGEETMRIIDVCREKYPKQFLCVEYVLIDKELYPIGIFKCMKCGKPILHNQFNFTRLCGRCDTGQDNPKWIVKKPDEMMVVEEL